MRGPGRSARGPRGVSWHQARAGPPGRRHRATCMRALAARPGSCSGSSSSPGAEVPDPARRRAVRAYRCCRRLVARRLRPRRDRLGLRCWSGSSSDRDRVGLLLIVFVCVGSAWARGCRSTALLRNGGGRRGRPPTRGPRPLAGRRPGLPPARRLALGAGPRPGTPVPTDRSGQRGADRGASRRGGGPGPGRVAGGPDRRIVAAVAARGPWSWSSSCRPAHGDPGRRRVPANTVDSGTAILVGSTDAPVTVDLYEDFQCPNCKAFED